MSETMLIECDGCETRMREGFATGWLRLTKKEIVLPFSEPVHAQMQGAMQAHYAAQASPRRNQIDVCPLCLEALANAGPRLSGWLGRGGKVQ